MEAVVSLVPPGKVGRTICDGPEEMLGQGWLPTSSGKLYTLIFPLAAEGKVLLGMKKRGFGAGRMNGFGGKVEQGESILEAAKRELHEEANIIATDITACGQIFFAFEDSPVLMDVHVYRVDKWDGVIQETEEMQPAWHSVKSAQEGSADAPDLPAIPFDRMWPDDTLWLPSFLAGKTIVGRVDFEKPQAAAEGKMEDGPMRKWWFAEAELENQS